MSLDKGEPDSRFSLFLFHQHVFRTFDQHALLRCYNLHLIIQRVTLSQILGYNQSAKLIKLLDDTNATFCRSFFHNSSYLFRYSYL